VTVPAAGRIDVALPDIGEARAVLVTRTMTPPGGRPRGSLAVLGVSDGVVQVTATEGTEVALTPRLLVL
jgi:hypothetical protein